jgi:hypothetical protein
MSLLQNAFQYSAKYAKYQEIFSQIDKEPAGIEKRRTVKDIVAHAFSSVEKEHLKRKYPDYDRIRQELLAQKPASTLPSPETKFNTELAEKGLAIRKKTIEITNATYLIDIIDFDKFENFIRADLNEFVFEEDKLWLQEILFGANYGYGFLGEIRNTRSLEKRGDEKHIDFLNNYGRRFIAIIELLKSKGYQTGNEKFVNEELQVLQDFLDADKLNLYPELIRLRGYADGFRSFAYNYRVNGIASTKSGKDLSQVKESILESLKEFRGNKKLLQIAKNLVLGYLGMEKRNRVKVIDSLSETESKEFEQLYQDNEEIEFWENYLSVLESTYDEVLKIQSK